MRLPARPAAAAVEPSGEDRAARRCAGERGGGGAGDRPAGEGGARPRLGRDPHQYHAAARTLRRKGQASAGGEIVGGEAPGALDHHGGQRRAARRIERSAQQGSLVGGLDQGQPGGIEPQPGQPLAMEPGPPPPPAARADEKQWTPAHPRLDQRESERRRPVLTGGVDFVEPAWIQPRNPAAGSLVRRARGASPGNGRT